MPAGCNCGLLARQRGLWAVTACAAVLQPVPVSCHFRGCKVSLFRIVSGAISSELALPFYLFWQPGPDCHHSGFYCSTENQGWWKWRWQLEIWFGLLLFNGTFRLWDL